MIAFPLPQIQPRVFKGPLQSKKQQDHESNMAQDTRVAIFSEISRPVADYDGR
jgi:hypothetical protein